MNAGTAIEPTISPTAMISPMTLAISISFSVPYMAWLRHLPHFPSRTLFGAKSSPLSKDDSDTSGRPGAGIKCFIC